MPRQYVDKNFFICVHIRGIVIIIYFLYVSVHATSMYWFYKKASTYHNVFRFFVGFSKVVMPLECQQKIMWIYGFHFFTSYFSAYNHASIHFVPDVTQTGWRNLKSVLLLVIFTCLLLFFFVLTLSVTQGRGLTDSPNFSSSKNPRTF